MYKKEKITPNN